MKTTMMRGFSEYSLKQNKIKHTNKNPTLCQVTKVVIVNDLVSYYYGAKCGVVSYVTSINDVSSEDKTMLRYGSGELSH